MHFEASAAVDEVVSDFEGYGLIANHFLISSDFDLIAVIQLR